MEPVIEVLGYKVTIKSIQGQRADGIWHKEDHLDVWISFEPHVENVISTSLELPIKNYGKEEFIKAVKDEVERRIPEIEAEYRKQQETRRLEAKEQERLDSLAAQIESMIQQ